jgi:hypothetical protein
MVVVPEVAFPVDVPDVVEVVVLLDEVVSSVVVVLFVDVKVVVVVLYK